jgi:uncharacterized tellurite resistance protein B-like protein
MKKKLFLKTVFSCMACDGEIANEEINLVKSLANKTTLFEGVDVEGVLNSFIQEINKKGKLFLVDYLADVKAAELAKDEELSLLDLAFRTINSDNVIEYSEVKFFKKIRTRLDITDEEILEVHPEMEDFIQPDIQVFEEPEWNTAVFSNISLGTTN